MIRKIAKAAVDLWGLEDQMLMVGEEGIELAHAILKWRRAWKKYNERGISLTREYDDTETIESKAVSRNLEKATANVRKEAMQVLFMIEQLRLMQPGDYESILEGVLLDARMLLENRGVVIK